MKKKPDQSSTTRIFFCVIRIFVRDTCQMCIKQYKSISSRLRQCSENFKKNVFNRINVNFNFIKNQLKKRSRIGYELAKKIPPNIFKKVKIVYRKSAT